jgi:hypothetical protein
MKIYQRILLDITAKNAESIYNKTQSPLSASSLTVAFESAVQSVFLAIVVEL